MNSKIFGHIRFSIAVAYILSEAYKMLKNITEVSIFKILALIVLGYYAMKCDYSAWRSSAE